MKLILPKSIYYSPKLEIIDLQVEQGFATSSKGLSLEDVTEESYSWPN